ncbi:Lipid particle protein [Purpureocillium lavendulum]|uniref:Lipid particle protein n=1 Tax=Purpureocillium lavendulum TaxID=1247861 RepID=A0AB34FDI1_9HYPO|nr:Lipid particle protein [Purpureocillium lavendulum]
MASILAVMTLLVVNILALQAPLPGYDVVMPEWGFDVANGGSLVVNGTVEEAMRKLVEINPDYEAFFNSTDANEASVIAKRANFEDGRLFCGPGSENKYQPASVARIQEGMRYLRRLDGESENGALIIWRHSRWGQEDIGPV